METFLTVIHYVVCIFLILIILLQTGKGADIGAAFGAGGSQTLFGPRGAATFLNKLTAAVAGLFLLTSLGLVYFSNSRIGGQKSVLEGEAHDVIPQTIPTAETQPQTMPSSTQPTTQPSVETQSSQKNDSKKPAKPSLTKPAKKK